MAELIADRTWAIQGRTINLPVRLEGAEFACAIFGADPSAAAELLSGAALRPFTIAARSFSVLLLVHYPDWALGSYDEVGIGVLARGPGGRSPAVHILDLPVTEPFTLEAGRDVWALPKWLMSADLRFRDTEATVAIHDRGTFVMRARLQAGRLGLPFRLPAKMPALNRIDHGAQAGVLLRGTGAMSVRGTHLGRGRCDVDLGEHPMAHRMRALGMTRRPLLTVHARELSGELDALAPVN
jgi:hypothetical protein